VVETVYEEIRATFRLGRDCLHDLSGFRVRPSAKAALPNFCVWLNQQLQAPLLAFADLIDW
jgi:hypothetical protein